MALVSGVLGSVVIKLGKLLKEEYKLQTSVRNKIASLSRELESIHAALRKVADVPLEQLDEQVKLWASDVRELSYDIDNILDIFMVRIEGREASDPNRFKRAMKKIGKLFGKSKARRKIAGMIKIINEQAEVVAQRHRRYTVNDIVARPAATSTVDPRLAAVYKEVTQLVGVDKSCSELIPMLLLQGVDKSNKRVSVVGVGGLGKTTLAKSVYDKLKGEFECWGFIPVGRNPDLKKVLRDILIEIDKDKYMDLNVTILDERQLINELREYLRHKRYFIVIDDLWETKSWETIKLALVQNNCGSRLITTTRKLDVAIEAGEVYKLQPLPYDTSKMLFCTRIFGLEGKCIDNQLDEVSDKILKKCHGVPLAIITMASLLVGKSRDEWIEVCNSIAFRDKDNKQVNETEWILSLSYYDLPPHLKTCLLYLSAFPEDYIIDKDSLIWKWIAEGFVHKEQGTGYFEAGERYFYELINRSMIMAVESEMCGIVDGCCIHDMVLDLIRLKSLEENFVTLSSNNDECNILSPRSRVHRLAHHNSTVDQTHPDTEMDLRHLRTFIACRCDIINTELSFLSFELLHVLSLEDCHYREGEIHLDNLENLLHLRYLRLRGTYIPELPKGIGALKFLQTLDCQGSSFLKELPWTIGLLTQLTCLHAGNSLVPNGVIGKLTSLEELQIRVFCDEQFVKDLGKLRELRVLKARLLGIYGNMESYLAESLGNLHKIRDLTLDCLITRPGKDLWDAAALPRPLRCLIVPFVIFYTLPSCINPSDLSNLSHLDLYVDRMDEQSMKTLGGLPELRHLSLFTASTVTVTLTAADGFFQKLRFCSVPYSVVLFVLNEDSSVSFTIWNASDATAFSSKTRDSCIILPLTIMQNLEVLCFQVFVKGLIDSYISCDNIGLQYLPSLQKVRVDFCCHDAFADEVEKEEAALRQAIQAHRNRPLLQIGFSRRHTMKRRTGDRGLLDV